MSNAVMPADVSRRTSMPIPTEPARRISVQLAAQTYTDTQSLNSELYIVVINYIICASS